MKVVMLHNRTATFRDLVRSYKDSTGVDMDIDVVRRWLAISGIFQRVANRKPVITRRPKADRLK